MESLLDIYLGDKCINLSPGSIDDRSQSSNRGGWFGVGCNVGRGSNMIGVLQGLIYTIDQRVSMMH
jgi:hypothetical protein